MRALTKYGAVSSLGSLVITALAVAPAGGTTTVDAESQGTAVAARRAATAGISFGTCPEAEGLPSSVRCGTVEVPLDYAEPSGRQISLTVSRVRASGEASEYQGAFVYNPGGPGASSMYFPMAAQLPEWKRIARAYDIVGYAPRGRGPFGAAVVPGPGGLRQGTDAGPGPPLPFVQAGARRAGEGVRAGLCAPERRRAAPLHLAQQRPGPRRAAGGARPADG